LFLLHLQFVSIFRHFENLNFGSKQRKRQSLSPSRLPIRRHRICLPSGARLVAPAAGCPSGRHPTPPTPARRPSPSSPPYPAPPLSRSWKWRPNPHQAPPAERTGPRRRPPLRPPPASPTSSNVSCSSTGGWSARRARSSSSVPPTARR